MNTIYIELPKHFNFQQTVLSHGWYQLLPFEFDANKMFLKRVYNIDNQLVTATVREANGKLEIESIGKVNDQSKLLNVIRHILRIDEDLSSFYEVSRNKFPWISQQNAGRLLRSPTVYEDLVKTICTTNCSWSLTKNMTTNLVKKLGEPAPLGDQNFPTAEQMAEQSVEFYKNEIRAGYRSTYLLELAEAVASGKVNPENWLNSELNTKDLMKEMKKIKGVGNYAAENLLKLVGRYDGLALDSFLRSEFYKKHNKTLVCSDKEIEKFYEKFGHWRGLAIWCDMTESWKN